MADDAYDEAENVYQRRFTEARQAGLEVDEAIVFAEGGSWEPVEHLTQHVYTERTA